MQDTRYHHIHLGFSIFLGLLLGTIVALLWIFHYFTGIRYAIPYATADALVIFVLTPIFALLSKRQSNDDDEYDCHRHRYPLIPSAVVVLFMTAVYLIFALYSVMIITYTLKIILSFVGAISFGIMFITFISMIFYLIRKR